MRGREAGLRIRVFWSDPDPVFQNNVNIKIQNLSKKNFFSQYLLTKDISKHIYKKMYLLVY